MEQVHCAAPGASNRLQALGLRHSDVQMQPLISQLDVPVHRGFGLLLYLSLQDGPPVLSSTARGQKVAEKRARELGAAGVLEQPCSRQHLLRAASPYLSVS